MNFRQQRLNKLILEELNNIIIRELEFKGFLVTLTYVEVSKDLDKAEVGVSALPSEKIGEAVIILKKFQRRLQYLLNEKIKIKAMPQIYFLADYGFERAARVEKSLMEDNNMG